MNEIDRLFLEGHVKQLSDAMDNLGRAISAQGIGVSVKLDNASFRLKDMLADASIRLSETVHQVSDASERYARSLVRATWALVAATLVLVIVTAVSIYK